jgi:hypothetical protein
MYKKMSYSELIGLFELTEVWPFPRAVHLYMYESETHIIVKPWLMGIVQYMAFVVNILL